MMAYWVSDWVPGAPIKMAYKNADISAPIRKDGWHSHGLVRMSQKMGHIFLLLLPHFDTIPAKHRIIHCRRRLSDDFRIVAIDLPRAKEEYPDKNPRTKKRSKSRE